MTCLSENDLCAFVEGHLSARETAVVHAHIDECEECRALVAGVASAPIGGGAASIPPISGPASAGVGGGARAGEAGLTGPAEEAGAGGVPRVNGYRIGARIGRGSMGEVYLAQDEQLERPVAIKFLSATAEPGARKRFLTEARAVARLRHRHIVTIHSCDISGERPYIVSELLSGTSLDRAPLPLPAEEVLRIATALASGLALAHRQGVLHRDIKPANVMRTDDGEIKLLDFGLAKLADTAPAPEGAAHVDGGPGSPFVRRTLTRTGALVGTPLYMAPEIWRGEKATPASDVYSLGAMLYELGAGRPAHRAKSVDALRREIEEAAPSSLRQAAPRVDPALAKVIDRCLARDPEARFRSGVELSVALEEIAARRGVAGWRRRALVGAAAAFAVLGVGVGVAAVRDRPTLPGSSAQVAAPAAARTGGEGTRSARSAPGFGAAGGPNETDRARRSIAIVPFANVSRSADAAWLSTAVAEVLGACFAAGEAMRVVPGEEVARMLSDLDLGGRASFGEEELRRIRQYSVVDLVVTGEIERSGKEPALRVRAWIRDAATGAAVASSEASGVEPAFRDVALSLGEGLLPGLGQLPISTSQASQVRAAMPASGLAARLLSEGIERSRANDFEAARERFERAAEAEPDSPVPHHRLAVMASFLGQDEGWRREAKLAFERSSGLLREHRMVIEAQHHRAHMDKRRALETLRVLDDLYPDMVEYGIELAREQPRTEGMATLARLRKLPSPAGDDPRIDLAEYWIAPSTGDGLAAARRATAAARARGARYIVGLARSMEGWSHWDQGDVDLARAAFDEALPILEARGDTFNATEVMRALSAMDLARGDLDSALASVEKAEAHLRRIGNHANYIYALAGVGAVYRAMGEIPKARKKLEEAVRVGERAGNKDRLSHTWWWVAVLEHIAGDIPAARAAYGRSLQSAADLHDVWLARSVLGDIGLFYTATDEPERAREAFERILRGKASEGRVRTSMPNRRAYAELELSLGRTGEALRLIDECLTEALREKATIETALAETTKARVLVARGDLAGAIALVDSARARVEPTTHLLAKTEVMLGWVRVHGAGGEASSASSASSAVSAAAVDQVLSEAAAMARRAGFGTLSREARFVECELLAARKKGAVARSCFAAVAAEARAAGFLRMAREASAKAR